MRRFLISGAVGLMGLVLMVPVQGAFPGRNGKIAFTRFVNGGEIYVMSRDGSHKRRLTNNSADDSNPTFSPSGRRIAFGSRRDGNDEIYTMRANGTHQRRLTNDPAADIEPAFSPGGRRIVFLSDRAPEDVFSVYRMRSDGTHVKRLSNRDCSGTLSWSPNGQRIAFEAGGFHGTQIWTMRPDGSHERPLTRSPRFELSFLPDFSPNGRRIVFSRQKLRGSRPHIWIIRSDGTHQRRLTSGQHNDLLPVFSPNGEKIAYGDGSIKVMRSDGSHRHALTHKGFAENPSWGVRR
jgi:Tol biopolymer transport system component